MSTFDYTLSTITKYRTGSFEDPFVPISESKKISSKLQIQLSEIPVVRNRVQITGFVEVQEVPETGLATTDFIVDYNEGICQFHSSKEGVTVNPSYYGRGNHYVSSSRIWTQQEDGNITQTLDDVVSTASNFYYAGSYSPSTIYEKFNLVIYSGGMYICIKKTTAGIVPTNASYWVKISSITYRGIYSSSATYQYGDFVSDVNLQSVYTCIVPTVTGIPLYDNTKFNVLIDASGIQQALDAAQSANEAAISAIQAASDVQDATANANDAATLANIAAALAGEIKGGGVYDFSANYLKNNIVTLSGSSYIALQDVTGVTPDTDPLKWQLLAEKGLDGTGAGTVTNVSSVNGDIQVSNPTTTPVLTLNSGTGANQIVKRDGTGKIVDLITHESASDPHTQYIKADGTRAFTGLISLSADPTSPLHAATKQYVDNKSISLSASNGISVTGSAISGIDATTSVKGVVQLNNTISSTSITQAATANAVKTAYDLATAALPKTGGTMTGLLTLSADPTSALHAASKQYVDNIQISLTNYDDRPDDVTITVGVGKQYTSIVAALASLKKVNAGKRIIQCTDTHVENNSITISGFHGGSLQIISTTGAQITINGSIAVEYNSAPIWLSYITVGGSSSIINCRYNITVRLQNVINSNASQYGAWLQGGGVHQILSSAFSNHTTGIGVKVDDGTFVYLSGVTGTGNATGISVTGGIVTKDSGSTITGTNPATKGSGGQIFV